ncbi:hypothetical protein UCRPC4_g02081 [Phaeomoniella chlamydospora]|uniref:N-acetyltransferase domain-containing protein n=1 Tax=Phaeomoniella chlamydospora TaxID=158046 RepID=A0A0G2ES10_PHACM|nr:hypothetical protein UCRPC4_g02081 [Phaeomoniella chlamydospora]
MGFQPHVISSREFVENPDMKLLTSVPHDATVSTMAESKTPSLSEVSEIPENAVCKATSKGSEHQEPPEGLQDANERHQLPVKSDEQSVILQPEESFQKLISNTQIALISQMDGSPAPFNPQKYGNPGRKVSTTEQSLSPSATPSPNKRQKETAEKQKSEDYLKHYRTLTDEEQQSVLKKQQELQTALIGQQAQQHGKKGTTSLATLKVARVSPPKKEVPDLVGTAHLNQCTPSGLQEQMQQAFEDTKENSPPRKIPEASYHQNGQNIGASAPMGAQDLVLKSVSGSKWSTTKPSPLRNAVKLSSPDKKAENEQIKDESWEGKPVVQAEALQSDDNSSKYASDLPSGPRSSDSASNDMRYGKLFKQPPAAHESLANWDGDWAPAPPEWHDRPAFNNNDPGFIKLFDSWLDVNARITTAQKASHTVPYVALENSDLWPDGLFLVERGLDINETNCRQYGYSAEVMQESRTCESANDPFPSNGFEDWGKVDMSVPLNAMYAEETAAKLVNNYNAHKQIEEQERAISIQRLRSTQECLNRVALQNTARANIYIRPAVRKDVSQLVQIYNHHVEHSPRTTELSPIDETAMVDRIVTAWQDKLPFLVALSRKSAPTGPKRTRKTSGVQQLHFEKIVGYALAQDFSGIMLAERYTSEFEVYVRPEWYRKGIATSLLDKLLEVCDAGWCPKQMGPEYLFECDPEISHMYGVGGRRDLIAHVFVLRYYKTNKPGDQNDYPWIKEWLAKFGFEQQGCLDSCSVKNGRLMNMAYLVRRAYCQYKDGLIP